MSLFLFFEDIIYRVKFKSYFRDVYGTTKWGMKSVESYRFLTFTLVFLFDLNGYNFIPYTDKEQKQTLYHHGLFIKRLEFHLKRCIRVSEVVFSPPVTRMCTKIKQEDTEEKE